MVYPGAPERGDTLDDDCDGVPETDADCDTGGDEDTGAAPPPDEDIVVSGEGCNAGAGTSSLGLALFGLALAGRRRR